ncbi:hypothetical protein O181_018650 [Austropuccinia psidii MF-1]|uniref:Laccase n=1 Tax=Austropuccinia psidii MF-1 TaxID=1389203 RepID=A0A9Q3CA88_9BASI|nr:hypothetical protein [Austropuccinia psidii MF-1]
MDTYQFYRYMIFMGLSLVFNLGNFSGSGASAQDIPRVNCPDLVLDQEHIITNVPQVRRFRFVVTNTTAAFDGFLRNVLLINNQFPAPLIEVNEGDTVVVEVENRLNQPLTLHWHGLFQRGTPWMDGPSSVAQCPIQPGAKFTYEFVIRDQFGTFWYHAHIAGMLLDGIEGPLIVHSPRDPLIRGRDFDREMVLFMNDWYHELNTIITNKMLSPEGYNGSTAAPSPNSALLNGIGFFDCEKYANGSSCKTNHNPLELFLFPHQRTRIRLIQGGGHAMFKVSVDNHPLEIIEVDATPIRSPRPVHRINIHNSQRYSMIVDTRNDNVGDSFYLRAAMTTDCFAWLAPGMDTVEGNTALAIFRVVSPPTLQQNTGVALAKPTTKDWSDTLNGPCIDLNLDEVVPMIDPRLDGNVIGRVYFNISFGSVIDPTATGPNNTLGRFFINGVIYKPHIYKPLLPIFLKGGSGRVNESEVSLQRIEQPGVWDVVVSNLDAALDHPIHLHGVDSCEVAGGNGTLNEINATTIRYKNHAPLCRDTHVVPGGQFRVFRVQADNPGVWFLHCHIDYHLSAGLAGAIVMQPQLLAQTPLPLNNQLLCPSRISPDGNSFRNQALTSLRNHALPVNFFISLQLVITCLFIHLSGIFL